MYSSGNNYNDKVLGHARPTRCAIGVWAEPARQGFISKVKTFRPQALKKSEIRTC